MKKINQTTCLVTLLWLTSVSLYSQTYIYLDETFKAANPPMPVKRKGISSIGKFEFGPYRIISGKAGWTTTKSNTDFISGNTRSESNTNISFLFTGPAKDTITSNILFTSVTKIDEQYGFAFRTITKWSNQIVTENYEVYLANYVISSDTSRWNLVLAYPVGDEIRGNIQSYMLDAFKGVLADSQTSIDIIPEFRWENGKQATMLKPVEGYLFKLDGETVAAVQLLPQTKVFTWIKQDLPDNMKFVLAAGAATMMVRSER